MTAYDNALQAIADAVHAAGQIQEHNELMAQYGAKARGWLIHYSSSKVIPTDGKTHYVSQGAAERAVAKRNAKRRQSAEAVFTCTEARKYYATMKLVVRRNVMGGRAFLEREDTPYYCSPSSETYWQS